MKAAAHVDSGLSLDAPEPEDAAPGPAAPARAPDRGLSLEQDKELLAIFERTYGKVERNAFRPQPRPARTSLDDRKYNIKEQDRGPEYLLVDGYNIIFAMDAATRLANGIDNLPGSLEEAVCALESDELMAAALGEHVFPRYVEGKMREWDEYRTQVTDWELARYMIQY